MKRKQTYINIIALVVVLICGYFTVTDGMITLFGQSQFIQYLFNFVYIVMVLPTAIAVSDLYERLHPEENEANA